MTPEFIKWFDEDDAFMQKALSHIHQNWSAFLEDPSNPDSFGNQPRMLKLRVAVVDRLPFPDGKSSGCPGISLSLTVWSRKAFHADQRARKSTSEGPYKEIAEPKWAPPHIATKIHSLDKNGEQNTLKLLLRPANTLFLNGLQSTMFVEFWVRHREPVHGPKCSRQGGRHYVQSLSFGYVPQSSTLTVPLQRLTEAREISISMGNVISKLVGKVDSEPTSASLELEEKVSVFMKSTDVTNGTLNVFALIVPKSWPPNKSQEGPAVPAHFLGYQKSMGTHDADHQEQPTLDYIRLAISKGAHLHKVTSGGGGWGKKQGLLSLEPAMGLGSEEHDLNSLQASDLGELSGVPGSIWAQHSSEIARAGDTVEFFGILWSKEGEEALVRQESLRTALKAPDTKEWGSDTWVEEPGSNIIWGVTSPQESTGTSTISTLGNKLITIPHQFGMLSERGMVVQRCDRVIDKEAPAGLAVKGMRVTSLTRIDVPHTILTCFIPTQRASPADPVAEIGSADTEAAETETVGWRTVKSGVNQPVKPCADSTQKSGVRTWKLGVRTRKPGMRIIEIPDSRSA